MKQEQESFEIKEWIELAYSQRATYSYITAANNEIRRLQGEVRRLIKTNAKTAADALAQLAAAPIWGEWQDATVENLSKASVGLYEFETNDGMTFLVSWRITISGYPWLKMDGETCRDEDFELNPRFRRLNYTPKPAREVEKKYELYLGDGRYESLTATEIADDAVCDDDLAELARDLLDLQEKHAAAQARIRELEGK